MQPLTNLPRAAVCTGAAAINRSESAFARACLALGVLTAAAVHGT